MKANHNHYGYINAFDMVVTNISRSKNESKSQLHYGLRTEIKVVTNISRSKNESKSQLCLAEPSIKKCCNKYQ